MASSQNDDNANHEEEDYEGAEKDSTDQTGNGEIIKTINEIF